MRTVFCGGYRTGNLDLGCTSKRRSRATDLGSPLLKRSFKYNVAKRYALHQQRLRAELYRAIEPVRHRVRKQPCKKIRIFFLRRGGEFLQYLVERKTFCREIERKFRSRIPARPARPPEDRAAGSDGQISQVGAARIDDHAGVDTQRRFQSRSGIANT